MSQRTSVSNISRSSSLQVKVDNPPTYEEAVAETLDSRRRGSQNTISYSEIEEGKNQN
ncbi:8362_t:CDS:2 [Scutellospora calospora]|uniref:8362_t:CDS:1 n=1 Tax=Scutellospora calospora TaxID=85575 RepID=A0ACA9JYU0_9GLOM|nr:8362_t:CDS:2 [Scutellospora calospora]